MLNSVLAVVLVMKEVCVVALREFQQPRSRTINRRGRAGIRVSKIVGLHMDVLEGECLLAFCACHLD